MRPPHAKSFTLLQATKGVKLITVVLTDSAQPLLVLFFLVLVVVICFASLIFHVESFSCPVRSAWPKATVDAYEAACATGAARWIRPGDVDVVQPGASSTRSSSLDPELGWLCCTEHNAAKDFPSVLSAVWFTFVSITTVGYGDVVPRTSMGRFVTLLCLLVGTTMITLPVAVIGGRFHELYDEYYRVPNSSGKLGAGGVGGVSVANGITGLSPLKRRKSRSNSACGGHLSLGLSKQSQSAQEGVVGGRGGEQHDQQRRSVVSVLSSSPHDHDHDTKGSSEQPRPAQRNYSDIQNSHPAPACSATVDLSNADLGDLSKSPSKNSTGGSSSSSSSTVMHGRISGAPVAIDASSEPSKRRGGSAGGSAAPPPGSKALASRREHADAAARLRALHTRFQIDCHLAASSADGEGGVVGNECKAFYRNVTKMQEWLESWGECEPSRMKILTKEWQQHTALLKSLAPEELLLGG